MKGTITALLAAIILAACQPESQKKEEEEAQDPEFDNAMASVNALIGGGDTDQALKVLDSLGKEYSEKFAVWNTMGNVHNSAQNYTEAAAAFAKAVDIEPENGRALLNLGAAQINGDQIDAGMESLIKARATNTVNTNNVQAFPIYEKVKDHARINELLLSGDDFEDPFVEETRIIYEWNGEAAGDQFGWIARNIGDVNGDGILDMVTSSPTNDEGGNNAGKIYVYSGKDGEMLWSAVGDVENGQLGNGIEYGGDINGDGTPDVVAGAPFASVAYAYSGKDGSVIHKLEGDPSGGFGIHVSGVDDINNDGYGDILVGEPYQVFNSPINADSVSHPGKAHVFSGKDGSKLITWEGEDLDDGFGSAVAGRVIDGQTFMMVGAPNAGPGNGGRTYVYKSIKNEADFVFEADSTGSRLGGMFLSVVGDVNADGVQDLYASDWSNGAGGRGRGRAYVYSGSDGSNLYTWTGETDGEGFGIGVSDCGDVNKDGYADVAVGSWQFGGAAPGAGKVRLHSGKDGSLIRAWTCKTMGDTFGFDTTGLGDVDGDGNIDLLITSAWSSKNGFRSGRVFVISGV